jgi:hypothetical protein
MKLTYSEIEAFVRSEVAAMTGTPQENISGDTALIGSGRVIDSADLVMLLISVEDFAREKLGVEFDWTSDSAMSEARSVLRSVSSLARHLTDLAGGATTT